MTATAHPTAFGALLLGLRRQSRLSQGELALRATVHRALVSRYESGDRMPTAPVVHRLSAALHASTANHRALLHSAGFSAGDGGIPTDGDDIVVWQLSRLLSDPNVPAAVRDDVRAAVTTVVRLAGRGQS